MLWCAVLGCTLALLLLHTWKALSGAINTYKMHSNLPRTVLKTYETLSIYCLLTIYYLLLPLVVPYRPPLASYRGELTMHYHCLMSTVPTSTTLPSRTKPDRAPYDSPLHTKCAKEHTTTITLVLQFAPNL